MNSSNPVFRNDPFATASAQLGRAAAMTVGGVIGKTAFFLALATATGAATWVAAARGVNVMPAVIGGAAGGLVFALITAFKPRWAAFTGMLYALCQGVLLGGLSAHFNAQYPGIAVAAAGCTVATLAGMLFAYQTGLIRATNSFRRGVVAATLGIFLFYAATWVLGFFGLRVPGVFDSGWVGIGFSLFVVVIAALNLVLDFDFIEKGARAGAPKHMEWYAAFALMVTLVWLYLEILRLLAEVMGRK